MRSNILRSRGVISASSSKNSRMLSRYSCSASVSSSSSSSSHSSSLMTKSTYTSGLTSTSTPNPKESQADASGNFLANISINVTVAAMSSSSSLLVQRITLSPTDIDPEATTPIKVLPKCSTFSQLCTSILNLLSKSSLGSDVTTLCQFAAL